MKTKILFIIICNLIICNLQYTQNITNTLGTSGLFTIKDVSNNYLTLTQSTGQVNILKTLRLEYTTSSGLGIIFKGADRFLHNYQASGTNGYNTFLGINAGNFTMAGSGPQASYNTGIGFSLGSLTTGYENTAMGFNSLNFNTTGYFNTAVGVQSLNSNTMGFQNTAMGLNSLYSNDIGVYNTAVGFGSLFSNTFGAWNTALGYNAGSTITTGSNLTCIGNNSQPTTGSADHQVTLGDFGVSILRCAQTSITYLSDARDKKNIKDLSLGLDFVMKLKPRQFNWDKRELYENNMSDGSKMQETPTAGFIAQELDEVQTTQNAEWLNLVLKDNPEKWEATPGKLFPVIVKAIQELKAENDILKENNEKLSAEVESLKSMSEKLVKLEQMVNELTSVKHTSLIETEASNK